MSGPERPDVETASDGYARRFSGAAGAWFLAVQGAALRELLRDVPPGGRILDVGGGHAQLTPFLLAAGYETVVLGSAPEAVGRLEPYVREGRVRFDVGALDRLPYEAAAFDAVVSVRLLPHLDRWRAFVEDACRVSRRSVVVDYPSIRGLNRFAESTFAWKKKIEGNTRPFTLFHPEEVAAAFRSSGYELREARAQFFWPMVLHRMHGSPALGRALEAPARWMRLTSFWGSPILVRADRRAASGAPKAESARRG